MKKVKDNFVYTTAGLALINGASSPLTINKVTIGQGSDNPQENDLVLGTSESTGVISEKLMLGGAILGNRTLLGKMLVIKITIPESSSNYFVGQIGIFVNGTLIGIGSCPAHFREEGSDEEVYLIYIPVEDITKFSLISDPLKVSLKDTVDTLRVDGLEVYVDTFPIGLRGQVVQYRDNAWKAEPLVSLRLIVEKDNEVNVIRRPADELYSIYSLESLQAFNINPDGSIASATGYANMQFFTQAVGVDRIFYNPYSEKTFLTNNRETVRIF